MIKVALEARRGIGAIRRMGTAAEDWRMTPLRRLWRVIAECVLISPSGIRRAALAAAAAAAP